MYSLEPLTRGFIDTMTFDLGCPWSRSQHFYIITFCRTYFISCFEWHCSKCNTMQIAQESSSVMKLRIQWHLSTGSVCTVSSIQLRSVIDCVWWWTGSSKDGVRNKRKHNRQAQLSRAADAELAEICLEQKLLRKMMLPWQPRDDNASQPSSAADSTHSSVCCCCHFSCD